MTSQLSLLEKSLPAPSCALSDDGGGADGRGLYRYALHIPVSGAPRSVLFILANPSKAIVTGGVLAPDPTITRGIGFARSLGFGTAVFGNARAWRETDPYKVPEDPLAIGPRNDWWLSLLAQEADLVLCGWGKLGGARGLEVLRVIRATGAKPHALKLNADGSPAHPLYLPADLKPFPMEAA